MTFLPQRPFRQIPFGVDRVERPARIGRAIDTCGRGPSPGAQAGAMSRCANRLVPIHVNATATIVMIANGAHVSGSSGA